MVCVHLKELYQLCEQNQLKLSSTDLIRIVCKQCEKEDTCPSGLVENNAAQPAGASEPETKAESNSPSTENQ